MGCLNVNTYLTQNPEVAKRVSGVIWSAPFFGMHEKYGMGNPVRKTMVKFLAMVLEEFVLSASLSVNMNSRNKRYMREVINSNKNFPMCSFGLIASCLRHFDNIQASAKSVTYPYLMVLGDKDAVVSNKASKEWHAKTSSKVKSMRLMAGAYHELGKEPNNAVLFEASLQFLGDRIVGKAPAGA